nr:hypothetical protein [Tanacetum cinerariifolium]
RRQLVRLMVVRGVDGEVGGGCGGIGGWKVVMAYGGSMGVGVFGRGNGGVVTVAEAVMVWLWWWREGVAGTQIRRQLGRLMVVRGVDGEVGGGCGGSGGWKVVMRMVDLWG